MKKKMCQQQDSMDALAHLIQSDHNNLKPRPIDHPEDEDLE
jgi:hypothetical protein